MINVLTRIKRSASLPAPGGSERLGSYRFPRCIMTIYPNQKQQPSCQSFFGTLSKHIAVPGHFNPNVLIVDLDKKSGN